jgi:hypothetical protein
MKLIEQLNLKNTNNEGFPINTTNINWDDYINYLPSKVNENILNALRFERNKILQNTDWVLTHDNAISLLNLDDWIQYRQNLRDFFSKPSFKLILKDGTKEPDKKAMNFPPVQPPILRKT